ncbi:MAG: HlyD family secretion protein [Gammaproteobacteria bacterium]|nr:HlyD family secretion protein [Gammaproteobacteria bacterium]
MSDEEQQTESTEKATTSNENAPDDTAKDAEASKSVKKGTLVVLGVIVISLIWYLLADRFTPYTQQARVQGYVVGVAPKVAGLVTDVWVKNNELVEPEQPLFQIDVSQYEIALKRAESDLQNAESQVGASTAGIDSARAQLRVALAGETKARQEANRIQRLRDEDPGTISVRRLEQAIAAYKQAQANVGVAEAEIQRAIEQKGGEDDDNAKLKAAISAVEKAKLDLDNTVVRASTRGVITDLRAEAGQYAGTGTPIITLVAINDVWISAEFTENNLGHIKEGTPVDLVLDAIPGEVFSGKIRHIGVGVSAGQVPAAGTLPTIENNRDWLRQSQRFQVRISFNPEDRENLVPHVRVGGQAEVMAYSEGHGFLKMLGKAFIHFMSWLSYAY